MAFIIFLFEVVIISLTGVMAPGPVTAVSLGAGTKSPHAGAFIAMGHGIVEFPLMFLIFFGLGYVFNVIYVKMVIFLLGGLFLLIMGADMMRGMKNTVEFQVNNSKIPVISGILLSAGNAYFLLWWATVGATLIAKAITFGIIGFLIFAVIHWLCDFFWLYFLSAASYRSGRFLGLRFQHIVFGISGMFLLVFGVIFIWDGFKLWLQ